MEKIESYGNSSDAINLFKDLEYDGAIDLYSGEQLNQDHLDGSMDDWGIYIRDVKPI